MHETYINNNNTGGDGSFTLSHLHTGAPNMLKPHFWLFTYPIKRKENEGKHRSIQKSSAAAEEDVINKMIMSLVCNHNWNNGDVPDDLRCCHFNKAATVKENWRHEEICSTWQITPEQVLIFRERNTQKLISLPAVNETASCDSCCPAQKFN